MKLTKLLIAIATFATITLSSSAYIATKEVTSAVLVDKAKHSLDLTTNGLHNISVSEAFTIDKSEAAQINFLRCSFARPEFRFSWFCHQQKIDGKMTKNSYVALKDDQQKYFKENVIKSVSYEAQKWILRAEQMRIGTAMHNLSKKQVTNINEFHDKFEDASIIAKDVQLFNEKFKAMSDSINLKEIEKRFIDSESPSKAKDFDPKQEGAINADQTNQPAPVGAGQDIAQRYENEIDNHSLTEMIQKILKTGRYEDGIFYLDKPEYKYLLNIFEEDVGAKAIEDIYKKMIINDAEQILSSKSSIGIFNVFNRFLIYLNTEVVNNIVEHHYDRNTSTISHTYKYKEYFILGILLIILLQYTDSRYSRKSS